MGSGPVVIQDDGGPPLIEEKRLARMGMRVGRKQEFMQQLETANGCHALLSGDKAISKVLVNGAPQTISGNKTTVVVTGDGGTKITVSSDGTAVKVCTNAKALGEDLVTAWGRYKASDKAITAVSVNGGNNVLTGAETNVKVQIDVTP
jgi:hypothetical protein